MTTLAAAVLFVRPAGAAPDFSASTVLVSSESPLEADVVAFTLVVRNTGADDAGAVSLRVEWPLMGFFVDASGFSDAHQVDHVAREIEDGFPLAAGAERRFHIRVLAPRDSGGDTLTLAFKAAHYASGTEYYDQRSITIDTRIAAGGIDIGGYRVAPAGLGVLVWLVAGAVLWFVTAMARPARSHGAAARSVPGGIASKVGPGAAVGAVMVSVGFWAIFGVMAWRDYRSLVAWPETTCTILGGRLSAQTTTRTGTRPGSDTTNYVPVLGLRYAVDGRETFSSGYDTGSRLGIGGRGGRTEELAGWTVGAGVPCWYNPDDLLDVVVLRGFGGAYLFALFPLPVFLVGLSGLRRSRANL